MIPTNALRASVTLISLLITATACASAGDAGAGPATTVGAIAATSHPAGTAPATPTPSEASTTRAPTVSSPSDTALTADVASLAGVRLGAPAESSEGALTDRLGPADDAGSWTVAGGTCPPKQRMVRWGRLRVLLEHDGANAVFAGYLYGQTADWTPPVDSDDRPAVSLPWGLHIHDRLDSFDALSTRVRQAEPTATVRPSPITGDPSVVVDFPDGRQANLTLANHDGAPVVLGISVTRQMRENVACGG